MFLAPRWRYAMLTVTILGALVIVGAAARLSDARASVSTATTSTVPPFTPIPPVVPRASGDIVPSSAPILRLTWSQQGRRPLVISNASTIRRIAQLLNVLPVEGSGTCSQAFTGPQITFTFSKAPRRGTLASATMFDSTAYPVAWCIPTEFTVTGHQDVSLEGGGFLLKRTEAILGRKLT